MISLRNVEIIYIIARAIFGYMIGIIISTLIFSKNRVVTRINERVIICCFIIELVLTIVFMIIIWIEKEMCIFTHLFLFFIHDLHGLMYPID